MSQLTIRRARTVDTEAVTAFTSDTWGERQDDYIPRVFDEWVRTDDDTQRTLVATIPFEGSDEIGSDESPTSDAIDPGTVVEGDGTGAAAEGKSEVVVGCIQGVLLSSWEAWAQGIRVNPAVRGLGTGTALTNAVLKWARSLGATVCRNMVFSWNVAGLGQSRAVGFEPATEFRFARPEPTFDSAAEPAISGADPATHESDSQAIVNAAWAFWQASRARDHLGGLALDPSESWACSTLTRAQLTEAAADDRLLVVRDAGVGGFAVRTRITERAVDNGHERIAVYGVTAWRDVEATGALYEAIARDAGRQRVDATRVLIPETVDHVSDTAANRIPVASEPDFVLRADLTDPTVGSS